MSPARYVRSGGAAVELDSAPGGGGPEPSTSGSAAAPATTDGISVTPSATAHTKGSWTELVASTSSAVDFVILGFRGPTVSYLVDIGTGGAGSETVLISNLLVLCRDFVHVNQIPLPVEIPTGTRVAARCQARLASQAAIKVGLTMLHGGSAVGTAVQSYGANTADSGGTQVDSGGAANTKGSWSELTASTTATTKALMVAVAKPDFHTNQGSTPLWRVDIGTGAAASESVLIPDLFFSADTTLDMPMCPYVGPLPVEVASGTRLAARAQSTSTGGTDRLLDVAVYAIS